MPCSIMNKLSEKNRVARRSLKTEQQERDKDTRKCVEGLGNSLNENTTQTKVKMLRAKLESKI